MKPVPHQIKARDGQLSIRWSDAHESRYVARDLRLACRCAACVDEWTHESLIRPEQVPPVVNPSAIEVVGNYALQFRWNDGHSTGIFSYDFLREVCACDDCRKKREFDV